MAATVDSSRYDDLCRLCATKTSPSTIILGINIFENEGNVRQVSKKIETCLPVQVNQSDDLPKMICENCLYKLDMLFDFRERSLRTEKLLQDLIKELNHEKTTQQNLVAVDSNSLLMVPQHHLLDQHHHIQNVELDITHLSQRDDIIVSHGIILTQTDQHDLDLANLEINHHDLATQNLSNHSLHGQETMLMDHGSHFNGTELDMMHQQQQLLQEQFNIRHELDNLELSGVSTGSDLELLTKAKDENFNENKSIYSNNSLNSSDNVKLELLSHHEDSNSNENTGLMSNGLHNDVGKVFLYQDSGNAECIFCSICGTAFHSKDSFEQHYSTHFTKCPLCPAAFSSEDHFTEHFKESHNDAMNLGNEQINSEEIEPVENRLKNVVTDDSEDDYATDVEAGIPYETIKRDENEECQNGQVEENDADKAKNAKKCALKVCTECGKTYKNNSKLNEHMRKHTGEKPYKCNSCEKSFRSKIGLAQHEAKHTGQYEFSCPTCGKGFQCRSYLMVHQRVHSDVKPWPCTTCNASFKTKQSLLDHTNRHLGVKPYICEVCGRGFITKGLCKTHQKIHNGLDNRKYSCKICTKMFVSKSYLQTHLKIHTGEKPFICEVCGKGFLTRVDLRIHSTLHTGEKSYVCEICGKAFARRDALRCHRRSHTGERPYSCEICGQTFTQFTPMAIHKRLHTGERPYSCEVCKKTFVSRSTMMTHAKKHVT